MAERILDEFQTHLPDGVTLIPGRGGIFEVTLGERTLFSKAESSRFPNVGEVEAKLGKILGVED